MNTFGYVGSNPLGFYDVLGLKIIGNWVQTPRLANLDVNFQQADILNGDIKTLPPGISLALVTLNISGTVQGVVYCKEINDCGDVTDRWLVSPQASISGNFQFHVPIRIGPLWWVLAFGAIDTVNNASNYIEYVEALAAIAVQDLMAVSPSQWCMSLSRI